MLNFCRYWNICIYYKNVAEREEKKSCVGNRNVSNDCIVSDVSSDVSVVSNINIVGSSIVRSVSSVSNVRIVCNS